MYGENTLLVAVLCSRTTELESAQDDLLILGEGKLPTNEVDLDVQQAENNRYLWGGMVIVLFMIGLIGFRVKGRKKE